MKKRLSLLLLFVLICGAVLFVRVLSVYDDYRNPPLMRLFCDDWSTTVAGQATSWSYDSLLGRRSYTAQQVHPLEQTDRGTVLETYGNSFKIGFDTVQPDLILSASRWPAVALGDPNAEGEPVDVSELQEPDVGDWIYAVEVEYQGQEHYRGTAQYVFHISNTQRY
ncbi:MAG: hypothetical protein ACI3XT_07005 [Butyricicoccaceae bacterium]